MPGAGAAGGMDAALLAFLDAELRPGIQIVIETTGLERRVVGADLVITSEGKIDGQTVFGKTPVGVSRLAAKHGVPVIAIAGGIGHGAERVYQHGITAVFSIGVGPCSLEEALSKASENLRRTAKNVDAVIKPLLKVAT